MSKMIQIRNVPDTLHRELKSRAALAGRTLSDYLLRELRLLAARPTRQEMLERLGRRQPVTPSEEPAELLRQERARR